MYYQNSNQSLVMADAPPKNPIYDWNGVFTYDLYFIKKLINNKRPLYERNMDTSIEVNEKGNELQKALEFFTKEPFDFQEYIAVMPDDFDDNMKPMYKKHKYIRPYKIEHSMCCCTKKCGSLYLVKHIKTNIYFLVGSVCITKFEIDSDFDNKITAMKNSIKSNGRCDKCKKPLVKKTTKYAQPNWSIKNKLPNVVLCNKCINKALICINIPFDEKLYYKNKYDTLKWSQDSKTWYIQGPVPKELFNKIKPMHI